MPHKHFVSVTYGFKNKRLIISNNWKQLEVLLARL